MSKVLEVIIWTIIHIVKDQADRLTYSIQAVYVLSSQKTQILKQQHCIATYLNLEYNGRSNY